MNIPKFQLLGSFAAVMATRDNMSHAGMTRKLLRHALMTNNTLRLAPCTGDMGILTSCRSDKRPHEPRRDNKDPPTSRTEEKRTSSPIVMKEFPHQAMMTRDILHRQGTASDKLKRLA
jgi:hypothetical protein